MCIPVLYFVTAYITSLITVERTAKNEAQEKIIYLNTNGIHLDVIIPKQTLQKDLLSGLKTSVNNQFYAFGWGDENFYINTPTWNDLTLKNAFTAIFFKSTTLMHVTHYKLKQSDWVKVNVNDKELREIQHYINQSFEKNHQGGKVILKNKGYSTNDEFYKAKGSYSCLKTCNSWVNSGFKKSGLKCSLWTPFDFGLLNKYK